MITLAYCSRCKTGIEVAWVVAEADLNTLRGQCAECMAHLTFLPVHSVETASEPVKAERDFKWNYKLTPEQRLEVANLYAAGEKVEAIGARFGIRAASVTRIARQAGMPPRRTPGGWRANIAS